MKLSLEVIKGPETGRKFEFTQPDTFIVGRGGKDRPVHFKLSDDDPYVSRQHGVASEKGKNSTLRYR